MLVRLNPDELSIAIDQMAHRRRRPPRTPSGILDRLEGELAFTVASIRSHR